MRETERRAPTQAAIRRYRTLQEAYDSLPADPDYRSVVEVRRGTYEADLDAVTVGKKVAWIGQGFERSRGYGAALWVWTNSNCGIKVADETVFDRIIIDGGATVTGKETRPRPALVIKPATGTPKVGLINCVVRHWHTRDTTAGVTGYDPPSTGSILVLGGNLRLYHTTLYYSVGRNGGETGSCFGERVRLEWGYHEIDFLRGGGDDDGVEAFDRGEWGADPFGLWALPGKAGGGVAEKSEFSV